MAALTLERLREEGRRAGLFLIAGPCVIESEPRTLETAGTLDRIARKLGIPFVFKSSYDKANRSSIASFRGPGLEKGLRILGRVRQELGVPVLSDIHAVEEAGPASEVLDILQIPAFLCRQTDLLLAAGRTGRIVNVKKGQFLAPWDMKNVVEKLESTGCRQILLTERGASFGYNNLVADLRAIPILKTFGYPVVFDATHSVQLPGGKGTSSGGERQYVSPLALGAAAAGCDGLFMEVHPDPESALSDGPTQVPLAEVEGLLSKALRISRIAAEGGRGPG